MAAGGCFFALGLHRTKQKKPGLESFCSTTFALPPASAKISYALQPHRATIVLPDFFRSSPDDRKNFLSHPDGR